MSIPSETPNVGLVPPDLLMPSEAARLFGVRSSTLRRWVANGTLSAVKTEGGHYRYRRADVEALLKELHDKGDSDVR